MFLQFLRDDPQPITEGLLPAILSLGRSSIPGVFASPAHLSDGTSRDSVCSHMCTCPSRCIQNPPMSFTCTYFSLWGRRLPIHLQVRHHLHFSPLVLGGSLQPTYSSLSGSPLHQGLQSGVSGHRTRARALRVIQPG